MGTFYVTSPGEVLVRRDFFDIVEQARRRGSPTASPRTASPHRGPRAPPRRARAATVELSIFSADAAVHDAITRVPGSFERLMTAVGRPKPTASASI